MDTIPVARLLANAAASSTFDSKKVSGICELPHIGAAKYRQAQCDVEGMQNARMDNRRRGRGWHDLVGRRDVELGPRGRLGFGRDIAAC